MRQVRSDALLAGSFVCGAFLREDTPTGIFLHVQDRDAILQASSSRSQTAQIAIALDVQISEVLQDAASNSAAAHEHVQSHEPEQAATPAQGSGTSNHKDPQTNQDSRSALDVLGQMQIAAEQQDTQDTRCSARGAQISPSDSAAKQRQTVVQQQKGDSASSNPTARSPATQGNREERVSSAQQDENPARVGFMQRTGPQQSSSPAQGDFLSELLSSSYSRHAPGTGDMRHDTEGWRCLETSFKVWSPNWLSVCSSSAQILPLISKRCHVRHAALFVCSLPHYGYRESLWLCLCNCHAL